MSVLEKTGDEDKANRTYNIINQGHKSILGKQYLSGDVSNRRQCNLCHPVDSRVARPSGLGLLFDRARRSENMLVRLWINKKLTVTNLYFETEQHSQKREYCS